MVYNANPSMETAEVYAIALAANDNFNEAIELQTQAIFEALKLGRLNDKPSLQANMQRYRNGQQPKVDWLEVIRLEGPGSRTRDSE
jgi:hypothetical protein